MSKRVIDEEWTTITETVGSATYWFLDYCEDNDVQPCMPEAKAKLASAAPDMARLLDELFTPDCDGTEPECVGCRVLVVLRKAGLR